MYNGFTEIAKVGEVINLDFSRKEHREVFSSLYGGEDVMKKKLPLFYKSYAQARTLHESGKGLDYVTLLQLNESKRHTFIDGIDICYVNYDPKNNLLCAEAITSLTCQADYIDEHIRIQTKEGKIIYARSQSTQKSYTSSIKVQTVFDPTKYKSNILVVHYLVSWIDRNGGFMKAQLFSKETTGQYYLTNCIDSIQLKFPYSSENENVIICYGRNPAVKEKIDRTYQEAFSGGMQKLLLDVEADVKFKSSAAGFAGIDPTTFVLKLISHGMAHYNTLNRMNEIRKSFKDNGQGFSFSLDKDWEDYVPTCRLPAWDLADIQMTVEFDLKDGSKGNFTISSTVNKTQGNVYKAQKIYMLWGCIARDSRILMADGTERMIQDIRIGESVMLENLETGIVENVWKGIEKEPLVCFETADRSLQCTGLHPIKTNHGIKCAQDIQMEDCLINAEGREVKLINIYPVMIEEVYNLDIRNEKTNKAEGSLMICEGFLVGDNIMQNQRPKLLCCNGIDVEAEAIRLECEEKNRIFSGRKTGC